MMDPSLLGLIIFLFVMAVGLSAFIGLEVYGLVRRITTDLSQAANVSGARVERVSGDEEEIRPFPVYRDRRTVERLIEHFEDEAE